MANHSLANPQHLERLQRMFLAAPINRIFRPEVSVGSGEATIRMEVTEDLFHPGGFAHGVVYFKLLDSSAFLAANSLEQEFLLVTTQFSIQFIRPLKACSVHARANVLRRAGSAIISEAKLFDGEMIVAEGVGTFRRSSVPLSAGIGYV